MGLVLVTHDTASPALYGAAAAVVAAERGAGFAHLPARFDTALHPDAVQHVAASGHLVPSGLVWFERLTGRPVGAAATVGEVLHAASLADIVVPLHPAVMPGGFPDALRAAAKTAGVRVEHLVAATDGAGFVLRRIQAEGSSDRPARWLRDGFGRFAPASAERVAEVPGAALRIGLVGTAGDHRDVYPGALAALGDAADAAGGAVAVVFIAPEAVRAHEVAALLATVDGVLLPGGSDMGKVPGQILVARGALDAGVPTLGLCLGMQTMTTALAQRSLGEAGVNLAEADPTAALHSFVPMAATPGLPPHRLGEIETVPVAGTGYGDLSAARRRERFNHRYRLNPVLEPALADAGLRVGARDGTGSVVDAVEVAAHPFFIGLQGHPELGSRAGSPHPVLSAFVGACRRASERGGASPTPRAAGLVTGSPGAPG